MEQDSIRISVALKNEYADFLKYCTAAGKEYTSELTTTDYIAYRSQYGVSRNVTTAIKNLIDSYNNCDNKEQSLSISQQKEDSATLLKESQFDLPFFEILQVEDNPLLENYRISNFGLSVRATNALSISGCFTLKKLLALSPNNIKNMPRVGQLTFDEICNSIFSWFETREDLAVFKINQNNDERSTLSKNLREQVLNFLNEKSYSTDGLSEEEIDYFNKCVNASDFLDKEICLFSIKNSESAVCLKSSFEKFAEKVDYLHKIEEACTAISEDMLIQPICFYWEAYSKIIMHNPKLHVYTQVSDKLALILDDASITINGFFNDLYRNIRNKDDAIKCHTFSKWLSSDMCEVIHNTVQYSLKLCKRNELRVLHLRAKGHTLQEIGEVMGVTRERIRQLESKATRKCKKTHMDDVVFLIRAICNGDTILFEDEIRNELPEKEDADIFCFLLKKGVFDCDGFYYDKTKRALIFTNDYLKISEKFDISSLPDGIFFDEMEEIISNVSGNDKSIRKLIISIIKSKYTLYGTYYHRGHITAIDVCDLILKRCFPNGYKISDIDSEKLFRTQMKEIFGDIKILPTGRSIDSVIEKVGLLYDRGVYIHPSYIQVEQGIIDSINSYINESPRNVLSYDEIYDAMYDKLQETSITNKYILHGILSLYGCPYIVRRDYITKADPLNVSEELSEFIKEKGKIHKSFIMDEFLYDDIRLCQVIGRCPEVITLGDGYYIHSSNLVFEDEIVESIRKYIKSVCSSAPVSTRAMLDDFNMYFTKFVIENDIKTPGDLFGILKYLFKDEFYFSRPFIALNDVGNLNRKNVLMSHLNGMDSVDIESFNDICKSAGIHFLSSSDIIQNIQPEYVRIDESNFMRAQLVGISENVVFRTVDIVQNEIDIFKFLSCNKIEDFSWYPDINVEWTPFIVESIITGMCNNEIAYKRIPSGGLSSISNVVFVSEEFADDDYQSFVIKVLKNEHENNPFFSRNEILNWMKDKGLCIKKLPIFLEDDTYLYVDENNNLKFK